MGDDCDGGIGDGGGIGIGGGGIGGIGDGGGGGGLAVGGAAVCPYRYLTLFSSFSYWSGIRLIRVFFLNSKTCARGSNAASIRKMRERERERESTVAVCAVYHLMPRSLAHSPSTHFPMCCNSLHNPIARSPHSRCSSWAGRQRAG